MPTPVPAVRLRIAVVSAHYPPDFVSGGTLVPQRHARALRSRGHDVRVYAGSLSLQSPGDEVDETGLPIRWVPVADGIGWSSALNTANPRVTADFAAWLAEVRPDVVHLHSLQATGADLVRVARASGARTVVTMHDFWWSCARQFLVDKDLRPCSLVVEAGVCGCEVDRPWLDARNAKLAQALSHADVVCVPSVVAHDVAAANGLAPRALVVDENGVPPQQVERSAPSDGPVRFLYAGGVNPLKGIDVVLEAATLLAPGSWTLTTYGAEDRAPHPGPVVFARAYDPADLAKVLHAHDVLVVPSLMRESFSILTREALLHGLTVITSDSLGPEEVVVHGVNGLVVATGEAADLADAMRTLVQDRALLTRLRTAPVPVVRSLDDQVSGLEVLYTRELPPTPASAVRDVLFVCGIEGAPLRYRARLPAEALALQGIRSEVRHYRDPELTELSRRADAVVMYRVPATPQVLAFIAQVPAGVPVLFDVDDLIVDPSLAEEIPALRVLPEPAAAVWLQGIHRYRTTLEACDGYVGSTALLCEHIGALTGLPTYRFSNGVGLVTSRRSDTALRRPRRPGPLRVGYLSGSTTHDRDWLVVEAAVLEVLDRHPDAELWLVGHLTPTAAVEALGPRLHRLPHRDWRDLPDLLRDLDVNLAPLERDLGQGGRFNEAKSAIKVLEAALVQTPSVATPTQPFREAVQHGVNGLLADSHDEWVQALDSLLCSPSLRGRLGARARRDTLLGLSPHLQGQRYAALLEKAKLTVRVPRDSGWAAVTLDEPAIWGQLEPYTAEPVPGLTRLEVYRERVAALGFRLRAAHARGGVTGLAGAAGRRVRGHLR